MAKQLPDTEQTCLDTYILPLFGSAVMIMCKEFLLHVA